MIPLTICVGVLALLFWATNKYERLLRVMAKWVGRHEEKLRLNKEGQKAVIDACDVLMEIHPDPQSDEYRTAMELKLRLEKKARQ